MIGGAEFVQYLLSLGLMRLRVVQVALSHRYLLMGLRQALFKRGWASRRRLGFVGRAGLILLLQARLRVGQRLLCGLDLAREG